MSTIASPRDSSTLQSPTSTSARSSLSVDRPSVASTQQQRRNRSALRDFYNLKPNNGPTTQSISPLTSSTTQTSSQIQQSDTAPENSLNELDEPDFNAESYVQNLLANEGLEKVLRVESGLVGDIRGLDGEKKALVYDNYSKLIDATDTIRRMRGDMEPLTPMTESLNESVSGIVEKAGKWDDGLNESRDRERSMRNEMKRENFEINDRQKQVKTVKWVLDTPRRLRMLAGKGRRADAEDDWASIKHLLNIWEGVRGVPDLRKECEIALAQK